MNRPQVNAVPAINMELVSIRAALPAKLAELSKFNAEQALSILQDWGAGNKPLRELYFETLNGLDAVTS